MTLKDNTFAALGSGNFSKTMAENVKKIATKVIKSPGKVLQIGAKFGRPAVTRSPEAISSTIPDGTNFVILFIDYSFKNLSR